MISSSYRDLWPEKISVLKPSWHRNPSQYEPEPLSPLFIPPQSVPVDGKRHSVQSDRSGSPRHITDITFPTVIVAALVAVAFAGVVFAAEVKSDTKTETTTTSPSGEVKVEKKEVKKTVKHKKHHKKHKKSVKKEASPAEAPAAPAEAPAAK